MKYLILILAVITFLNCIENEKVIAEKKFVITSEQEKFIDTLQYYSFKYFINEINPQNGLVKDRSTKDSPSSIAAVGFAIPIWAIGAEKNWITRDKAVELTYNLMNFLINSEQSMEPDATGYNGFYYHFLDMQTGKRIGKCELSSIDTSWLLAGIRFARMYYDKENEKEKFIRETADSLTFRMNWDWWTKPESEGFFGGAVTMGWHPELGFGNMSWTGFNEGHYLYILAAGSGYKNHKSAYATWLKHYNWYSPYPGLDHACFPALFAFQWSNCFIDYRNFYDEYMLEKGIDYFENSRRATLSQQKYAIENPKNWTGYDSLTWGLTACDGPADELQNLDKDIFKGYGERGPSYPFRGSLDDGTIAPTGSISSIPFAPEIVIPTIMNLKEKYGSKGLWDKYGFKDSFNPTLNWVDNDYLGIDQGPIIIMIENYKTGFVWEYCMKDPVIQNGLKNLGFVNKNNL
ncbi:MAG: glucoamylase family protein [Melioribacteraceae bacterium]